MLVPYQTRCWGASINRERKWRTLAEVKQRGGWQADSSVNRYENHARLADSERRHSEALRGHLAICERQLDDVLLLGRVVECSHGLGRG